MADSPDSLERPCASQIFACSRDRSTLAPTIQNLSRTRAPFTPVDRNPLNSSQEWELILRRASNQESQQPTRTVQIPEYLCSDLRYQGLGQQFS